MDDWDNLTFEELVTLLNDDYEKTRINAAYRLSSKYPEDHRLFEIWLSKLEDEDSDVVTAAAEALIKYQDKRAIEPLKPLLSNEYHSVRRAAVEALTELGEEVVEPLLSIVGDDDYGVILKMREAFLRYKDVAFERLLQILEDPDPKRRNGAVQCLGFFADPLIISPLTQLLLDRSEDGEVRGNAADALIQLRDEQLISILINMLRDKTENNEVLLSAAYNLGKIVEPQAIDPMLEAVEDESEDVRAMAVRFIQRFQVEKGLELTIKALKDPSDWVRGNAFTALREAKSRATKYLLEYLKEEKDTWLFSKALAILQQSEDQSYIEPMILLLLQTSNDIWQNNGLPFLVWLKDKESAEVAARLFIPYLKDEGRKMRYRAAHGLRSLENRVAIGPLTEALYDSDKEIRGLALKTLSKFGDESALPALYELRATNSETHLFELESILRAITEIKSRH